MTTDDDNDDDDRVNILNIDYLFQELLKFCG